MGIQSRLCAYGGGLEAGATENKRGLRARKKSRRLVQGIMKTPNHTSLSEDDNIPKKERKHTCCFDEARYYFYQGSFNLGYGEDLAPFSSL
jgi:hypothetical protein